jgi:hypothetical protein
LAVSARAFIQGLTWGVCHARVYNTSREALDVGRFIFAGCIDAPDEIPAGGARSVSLGGDLDGIEWLEIPREP